MKSLRISCVLFIGIFLSITLKGQENGSVGIGIENPNPNAILHLVSPGNNQGLLIPTMTSSQRSSADFIGDLGASDNGLLVFDITDKTFYFWQDNSWQSLSAGNQFLQYDPDTRELKLSGGNTIDLSTLAITEWSDIRNTPADFTDGTDEVDDADADPLNEIQDLTISGTLLSISNNENATTIDLGSLAGTDSQNLIFSSGVLSLSGDPDATLVDLSEYDSDVTDDFDGQFSSLIGVPNELLDGDQVDDADADPLNEIQDLMINGSMLSITNNENATSIDLGSLGGGGGSQDLDFTGGVITLSGDPDNTQVDLSGYDADVTDDFDGQFSSLIGVPNELLDGDQINDADADPSNELQTLTRTDNDLILSNGGGSVSVLDDDADPTNEIQELSTNGIPGNISLTGSGTLLLNVNDLDADPTNENQTVSAGAGININQNGQNFQVINALPDQMVSLTSGGSGNVITGGTYPNLTVDVPSLDDADADPTNEIQTLSTNNTLPGNLTLSDGGTVTLNVNDADADPGNELQSFEMISNILTLTNDPLASSLDFNGWDRDASDDFNGSWASLADVPTDFADGIDHVDDSDADPANEIQTLSYNYSNFRLTLTNQSTVIDLSGLNNASPWDDNGTNVSFDGLYANANNFTSTPKAERLIDSDFITNKIDQVDIEDSKFLPVFIASGTSLLSFIEPGRQGQEIILMVIGGGTLEISGTGGNLHLSSDLHELTTGSTLHLVYFKDLINGTDFDGWMELSKSIATR